jgi:hypothetical protein
MKWTLGITVVCVAMMAMGAHGRADDRQSPCTRMGHTWVEFWNGRDVTTAFDVFTQDIVYEDVALGVVAEGARPLRRLPRASSLPSLRPPLRSSTVSVTGSTA